MPGTITISSPVQWQTFQRSGDTGPISISGTYTGSPPAIEARFDGGAWTTIATLPTPSVGIFAGVLSGQPAGQGTLEVRHSDDGAVSASVTYIGIGDIFVVAGQSNAAGYGSTLNSYSHATLKAAMFRQDNVWRELADPTDTEANTGSAWPLLATYLMAATGYPVAFLTTAQNGTGLLNGQWYPGGSVYDNCINLIHNSGVNDIRAFLWFQGEEDVNEAQPESAYESAMQRLIARLADDTGFNRPLLAAQIGYKTTGGSTAAEIDPIRTAQSDLWQAGANILFGPLTYDIGPHADGVHIGSGGADADMAVLAARWFDAIEYHFWGGSAGPPTRAIRAKFGATRETIAVKFAAHLTGGEASGWSVSDSGGAVAISDIDITADVVTLEMANPCAGETTIKFASGNTAVGSTLRDGHDWPVVPVVLPVSGASGARWWW